MNTSGAIASPPELPESQRAALVKLLADDDPSIFQAVRKKILSYGPVSVEWLRPHIRSNDPVLRRRAQRIIFHFDRQAADDEFLAFCLKHGQELDLERGVWLLARTMYPDISVEAYEALLDSYAMDLKERLDFSANPRTILTGLNHYLFGELKFCGNEKNFYDPENSYLNRVLDRRTGNPINLCVLYLLLSRRLRLPVTGIGLPGHFICRHQSSSEEIYIDVFNSGKFLTKGECVQFLLHGNFSLKDDYLSPVTPRRTLLRICSNLHQIYLQLELADEATRLQRYLIALAR